MVTTESGDFAQHGKDIARAFMKLGATSYGGPAIMGLMQAELVERRRWVSRERFVEGLSLVNMLPGATAAPLGVAAILVLAGAAGIFLFHSRRVGAVLTACIATTLAVVPAGWWSTLSAATASPPPPTLGHLAAYFFKVGALTVGGGLTMIAFMQQQVVEELHWLSAREFVEGLALGQLTPGPILMLAAFVGYKVAGVGGAAVAAAAAFVPSFVLMLALLPVLDRVRA